MAHQKIYIFANLTKIGIILIYSYQVATVVLAVFIFKKKIKIWVSSHLPAGGMYHLVNGWGWGGEVPLIHWDCTSPWLSHSLHQPGVRASSQVLPPVSGSAEGQPLLLSSRGSGLGFSWKAPNVVSSPSPWEAPLSYIVFITITKETYCVCLIDEETDTERSWVTWPSTTCKRCTWEWSPEQ